jgi:Rho termination factor, N-terminal domain
MRKGLLIALAAFAAALTAGVIILLCARASRPESVVSERPLDAMTRDELYELARELDIPGRSKMKKPELRAAVSRAGRSG